MAANDWPVAGARQAVQVEEMGNFEVRIVMGMGGLLLLARRLCLLYPAPLPPWTPLCAHSRASTDDPHPSRLNIPPCPSINFFTSHLGLSSFHFILPILSFLLQFFLPDLYDLYHPGLASARDAVLAARGTNLTTAAAELPHNQVSWGDWSCPPQFSQWVVVWLGRTTSCPTGAGGRGSPQQLAVVASAHPLNIPTHAPFPSSRAPVFMLACPELSDSSVAFHRHETSNVWNPTLLNLS